MFGKNRAARAAAAAVSDPTTPVLGGSAAAADGSANPASESDVEAARFLAETYKVLQEELG
jgi:hypothetical protein